MSTRGSSPHHHRQQQLVSMSFGVLLCHPTAYPSCAQPTAAPACALASGKPAACSSPHTLTPLFSAISLSTTPAARDFLALKDAAAAPPPPHAAAAVSSINGSHSVSHALSAADTAAAADFLDAAFSSFCPEVKSIIGSARSSVGRNSPLLHVQALSYLPLQPMCVSLNITRRCVLHALVKVRRWLHELIRGRC
jgi:hypothetical protein